MPKTMPDATLPPLRSSSAPFTEDGNRSDSSKAEVESDTSLINSSDILSKEDGAEEQIDNKQKRKRTRYDFIPRSQLDLYT